MTKPVALITGITGQDGSYLCELLLSKALPVKENWTGIFSRILPLLSNEVVLKLITSPDLTFWASEVRSNFETGFFFIFNSIFAVTPSKETNKVVPPSLIAKMLLDPSILILSLLAFNETSAFKKYLNASS